MYMYSNDDQIGSQMSSSVRHFWEIDGTITALYSGIVLVFQVQNRNG